MKSLLLAVLLLLTPSLAHAFTYSFPTSPSASGWDSLQPGHIFWRGPDLYYSSSENWFNGVFVGSEFGTTFKFDGTDIFNISENDFNTAMTLGDDPTQYTVTDIQDETGDPKDFIYKIIIQRGNEIQELDVGQHFRGLTYNDYGIAYARTGDSLEYVNLFDDADPAVVPEPATFAMLGMGLFGMARRLKKK